MTNPYVDFDSRVAAEREQPMSAAEWKEKAEERKRMKALRQMQRALRSQAGEVRRQTQMPIDITCRPDDALIMDFTPPMHPSSARQSSKLHSLDSDGVRRESDCGAAAAAAFVSAKNGFTSSSAVNDRGTSRVECLKEGRVHEKDEDQALFVGTPEVEVAADLRVIGR